MPKVTINRRDDLEKALKQFKMRCKREGIFKECKDRKFYTKPSAKKRLGAKKIKLM
jgi:ribosomal protein S21